MGPLRSWPGGLCVSRSIGDIECGAVITCLPHVRQIVVSGWVGWHGEREGERVGERVGEIWLSLYLTFLWECVLLSPLGDNKEAHSVVFSWCNFQVPSSGGRIIIASDGLWDALSSEKVASCVRGMPGAKAASHLIKVRGGTGWGLGAGGWGGEGAGAWGLGLGGRSGRRIWVEELTRCCDWWWFRNP